MRFVTQTRLSVLEDLIQLIPDVNERSYALHLLKSLRSDIDDNYAEIYSPISVNYDNRPSGGKKKVKPNREFSE